MRRTRFLMLPAALLAAFGTLFGRKQGCEALDWFVCVGGPLWATRSIPALLSWQELYLQVTHWAQHAVVTTAGGKGSRRRALSWPWLGVNLQPEPDMEKPSQGAPERLGQVGPALVACHRLGKGRFFVVQMGKGSFSHCSFLGWAVRQAQLVQVSRLVQIRCSKPECNTACVVLFVCLID